MTLAASRITVGFEPIYNKTLSPIPNPVDYELTPAEAFTRGDMVTIVAGKITKATAGTVTDVVGVMAESVAAADNPSGKITLGKVYDHPDNVYRVTFVDQFDGIADAGSTTGKILDAAIATSANDVWNGALLYVYEGPAAGSVRTVSDYVGATDELLVDTPFPVAPTTDSKFILLGAGAEANDVINVGLGGIVLKDSKTVDANAGRLSSATKVGPLVCLDIRPADLMMDVMIRKSCHIFG